MAKAIRRAEDLVAWIEEGFLRFLPKDSAHYYRMARASLGETRSHLRRGLKRGHITQETFEHAMALAESAMRTTMGLLASRLKKVREEEERRKGRAKRACPTGE